MRFRIPSGIAVFGAALHYWIGHVPGAHWEGGSVMGGGGDGIGEEGSLLLLFMQRTRSPGPPDCGAGGLIEWSLSCYAPKEEKKERSGSTK